MNGTNAASDGGQDLIRQDWEALMYLWLGVDIDGLVEIANRATAQKMNSQAIAKVQEFLESSLQAYRNGGEDESIALCQCAWERANLLNFYLSNHRSIKTGSKVREASKQANIAAKRDADRRATEYQAAANEVWVLNPKISKLQMANRIVDRFMPESIGVKHEAEGRALLARERLVADIRKKLVKPS